MLLRFTKMHGLGNDFVFIDLISQSISLSEKTIAELGDRRTGVGFDQLLTVSPPRSPEMDFRYRIFNADGTEAEQCGNGARCFLRFVRDRGLTTKTSIKVETTTGIIECRLEKDGNISVDMGPPTLQPDKIPFITDKCAVSYDLELSQCLTNQPTIVSISAVNMGNPHAVLVVNDVNNAPVNQIGVLVESHPRFPQKVNVGFMQIISRTEIKLRVHERVVGETRACGTGACAAVVAGRLQGLLDEKVNVTLPGGELNIEWKGDQSSVIMTGPASRVYEGRVQI
ncbi:MAG: diaminopimelate epimerase [Candidatus Azotimanducaceae bacterium]|jgi:diaminopimelate epimerase